jgi:cell wall-associated NlpC family hydrolase
MTDIAALSSSSSSLDPWASSIDDEDDDRHRPTVLPRATAAAARDAAELPDPPALNGALLARAATTTAAPRPSLAMGIPAGDVANVDSAATPAPPVERRLDAFRATATPTYRLPDGTDVTVAAPFRMPARLERQLTPDEKKDPTTLRYAQQEGRVVGHKAELAAIAGKVGLGSGALVALYHGHGTPQQVRTVTQALLDAGKLPVGDGKPASAATRVRQMMCDYGLGFDCSGYTQQAFLAAQGVTRAQVGFANPTNEGLSALGPPHFQRVAAPEDARPGDVVVLGPPEGETVGHRAIIAERHELTSGELQRLGCSPADRATLAAGHVTVFAVDSSWGSGADPSLGGVQRHTWLYDAATKRWGTVDAGAGGAVRLSARPYADHPLEGIYRYAGSS